MCSKQAEDFAWFKKAQDKLSDAFLKEGYDITKAQELGFLMAQAIRDVPSLLRLLDQEDSDASDEILDAVHMVLSNHSALNEAARMLLPEK
jgi:hypothetical protein